MSAIGQLFELKQLPLEKRKQLYDKFLKDYPKLKNPLKEIRTKVWQKTKDKEILLRFTLLISKISATSRLQGSFTETNVYNEINKIVTDKNFLLAIGKKGEPIDDKVLSKVRKSVAHLTKRWKGPKKSHTGGARARLWLDDISWFIGKNDFNLVKWLESFDCPTMVEKDLKKIGFSSRDSTKFLVLVANPKLNEPEIPLCVGKFYPKHAKCFNPRINDEVAKFFLRTGCITIKSCEEYFDIPEKGFDVKDKEFVGVSYPIFYGPIYDKIKKTVDPSLFAEKVIQFCSDSIDGICTDENPKCESCHINKLCLLSKLNGGNPEIVISTPEITDVYSGKSKPKTSTSCLLK